MTTRKKPSTLTLTLYQPKPNVLYSLDVTVHLTDVPRRSILIYCCAGLVQPTYQPPHGIMCFSEEAIQTIRQIAHLQSVNDANLACIKTMLDLHDEVKRLRAELRFLRGR